MLLVVCLPLLSLLCWVTNTSSAFQQPGGGFSVKQGDRISLIGNTLADRMQHDGWLETYIQSRFPDHQLVFRNLGFSGDELTVRLRSANFGSPDDWLTKTKSDVVFAFFGYNESFGGEKGLPKFKADLEQFIQHTLRQKYNGQTPPRLVLFSPIAHEDIGDPNLPDVQKSNQRLEMYTQAMAEVAKAQGITFVDLFHPTKELFERADPPLTINGIHLTSEGNQQLAQIIDQALFGKMPTPERPAAKLEKIRQAVLDRNFHWFNRYRTVDGYSIYGGRADLKFVDGQTNREVMQREMEILDVMTANRDKRVWAAAQGKDIRVDDSNLPPFIPVKTNHPGPLPGGKHIFLSGEEAIKKMTLGKGLKITLFADEKQFPDLINPVQMSFDTKGRLWVAAWPTYPHWKPTEPMNDKLLIFEDNNGDGKADTMKVFADDLHNPTGFEFWNGGVLVAHAPDILFLKDTDGDDKADVRIRMLSGIDSADTHHTANSFTLDPGGALYFQEGTFHHTQVETPYTAPVRCANAGVFRLEPRTRKFDVYVNFGFANPHGHAFDRWGQDIVVDGTGSQPYHAALFSGQTADYRQRHAQPPTVYRQKTRPCPAIEYLSSRHFPEEFQGNLLVQNVIGFQGILRYKVKDDGSSFKGIELEPIVSSTDPNFRPVDMEIGPDGALYFVDWQNPIIGHMQHNLRDPSRDREHGRIYKITYEGRELLKPIPIHGEPLDKLLNLLKEPEDRVRYRARIELGGRPTKDVMAALEKWLPTLDRQDPDYEHHLMEALWLHQNHNIINEPLLQRMLSSPDFRARAAATRVLCYWRDQVKQPLDLLRKQINDPHPRVRLEAVRALSFFHEPQAMEIAIELLVHPDDPYLRFTFNETMNTLERRLGGNRFSRRNIAASLLTMLQRGNLSDERKPVLIETICRHGNSKELGVVWKLAADEGTLAPALRRQVFAWLAEAATTRQAKPNIDASEVQNLLRTLPAKDAALPQAIQLAAAWKIKSAAEQMRAIAANNAASEEARFAAIDGLGILGDDGNRQALQDLAAQASSLPLRYRAAVSLARLDLAASAQAAAKAIADSTEKDDFSTVIEAFLVRKDGPKALAMALEKHKISADSAKRILRAMYLAGHNDADLGNLASKLAGIDAAAKPPTAEEVTQLAALVMREGDATRGEKVFRRTDLGCITCHSINKAGGDIGPDLGPIGGSSPVDYIVRSILDPNQSIKEEYLTKVIVTTSGQIYTGIEVQRNRNQLVLKDATGKHITIPTSEIDEEAPGKSLMPEGVTRILTKGELLDLIRFVSELGKPGSAYAIPTVPTVQRWRVLRQVPDLLKEGVPNRDVVRDHLLRSAPEAWQTVYSHVDGTLVLSEVDPKAESKITYLQGEIQVIQPGPVELNVTIHGKATLWLDEELIDNNAKSILQLSPGRHRITARIEQADSSSASLRIALRKPKDSRAHFEVVHGKE